MNEGKWISKDFIKDRQFNLYSYVGNNPIGASDLLGLATIVLVYDGGDSMFNNWAQYIKAAIEKGESTAYGNNISYDVDNDHIIMLESSDDMFDKLKEIKDIKYLGTFGHGQRGMIYWSTNDGQVVMGIPGYKVVYEDGSQQLSLSELASLNFINFVTIEIYHCYAGRFYACSQDGRLLIDEEGECREAERGDIKKSVQSELYILLKKKNIIANIYANSVGISNGVRNNRGWPRLWQPTWSGLTRKKTP